MGAATTGAPSVADVQTLMDAFGSWFKAQYAALGLGTPSETATLAAKAQAARTAIMGDGSSANPGIQNSRLQSQIAAYLDSLALQSRYDSFFALNARQALSALDNFILSSLPSRTSTDGWKFTNTANQRPLDLWLTRVNANNAGVPATPAFTPTLTPATGGQIAPTTAAHEPRVKVTYVGSQDYYESQPSAASAQVPLTGINSAWTLGALPGTVPTGVTKLRVYRQLDNNAGSGDPYYWDSDVPVTAGQPFPAIVLTNSDQQLRQDWGPPSWLALLMLPEEAALYALAYASAAGAQGQQGRPLSFNASSFFAPGNVALNPVNGFLGVNNPSATALLAQWIATVITFGTIQSANDATQALQGFAGAAGGIQARVTGVLDAGASITNIHISYLDAAHPTTPQTATLAGPFALGTAVGSVVTLDNTAGRLITSVTAMTVGTATTGAFVVEALPLRSI